LSDQFVARPERENKVGSEPEHHPGSKEKLEAWIAMTPQPRERHDEHDEGEHDPGDGKD